MKAKGSSLYSLHPGFKMEEAYAQNLVKRTGKTLDGRLVSTGGFEKKDRITHRIPISSLAEIDAEVKVWLQKAYALDAPD